MRSVNAVSSVSKTCGAARNSIGSVVALLIYRGAEKSKFRVCGGKYVDKYVDDCVKGRSK